jgi:hypothetical protein
MDKSIKAFRSELSVLLYSIFFFFSRLNSLDYRDLKEKLQAPVRNARCIVIRQSLSEQFLQAFAEQVSLNPVFIPPDGMVKLLTYLRFIIGNEGGFRGRVVKVVDFQPLAC